MDQAEMMREVLDRFAEVHRWMTRNGHNPDDIDFLIRGPEGQIMGHLQVQSDDFRAAHDVLNPSTSGANMDTADDRGVYVMDHGYDQMSGLWFVLWSDKKVTAVPRRDPMVQELDRLKSSREIIRRFGDPAVC